MDKQIINFLLVSLIFLNFLTRQEVGVKLISLGETSSIFFFCVSIYVKTTIGNRSKRETLTDMHVPHRNRDLSRDAAPTRPSCPRCVNPNSGTSVLRSGRNQTFGPVDERQAAQYDERGAISYNGEDPCRLCAINRAKYAAWHLWTSCKPAKKKPVYVADILNRLKIWRFVKEKEVSYLEDWKRGLLAEIRLLALAWISVVSVLDQPTL